MSGISLYEDRMLIKQLLEERLKSYRNFSTKLGLLFFSASFTGHFAYVLLNTDHLVLRIDESLYGSMTFSLMFAVIGYCLGAIYGTILQKRQLSYIAEVRYKKRLMLEEQIALRKARLESL